MKFPLAFRYLPLLSLLFLPSLFFAQSDPITREVSDWFLEERFIIADLNEDALLDREEMAQFAGEFAYYLEEAAFKATDKNRDGRLSFNEIRVRVQSENNYRLSQERKALRSLAEQYPLLFQADVKYLRNRPELVAALFTNLTWLCEHAELAEKIYNDRTWMAAHPEVKLALHRNLRWMAAHPSEARDLYRDRSVTEHLPELLAWRADHIDFIRRHPRLERLYDADFIPQGVQVRRENR